METRPYSNPLAPSESHPNEQAHRGPRRELAKPQVLTEGVNLSNVIYHTIMFHRNNSCIYAVHGESQFTMLRINSFQK